MVHSTILRMIYNRHAGVRLALWRRLAARGTHQHAAAPVFSPPPPTAPNGRPGILPGAAAAAAPVPRIAALLRVQPPACDALPRCRCAVPL